MKLKTAITTALLAFVAGSAVYWIATDIRARGAKASPAPAPAPTASADRVLVYYFHGSARCATCIKFEAYTQAALQEAFSNELATGRVEWRIVNVEDPPHEHFIQDYQLTSKAVVVARYQNGQQTAWKNLEDIWELVKDEAVFKKYIQDGVTGLLTAR